MFLSKIMLRVNKFLNHKSVMSVWLISYISVLLVILILVGCAENLFVGFIAQDTVYTKTEEISAFSEKLELLTEECKVFAVKLAVDEEFKKVYMQGVKTPNEHFLVKEMAQELRPTMTFADDFFVYIKSENQIINSIGNVSTPSEYYNLYYKNSTMEYKKWNDEVLNCNFADYHVFKADNSNGIGPAITKFCYALPTEQLNGIEGVIFTTIDSSRYSKEVDKLNADENMSVLIYDESGKRYFQTGKYIPSDVQLEEMEKKDGFFETELNGEKVVMGYVESDIALWKYAYIIPRNVFWSRLNTIKYISVAIFLLIALLGIIGVYVITKYNYKTVAKVVKRIETAFKENTIKSKNEYVRINQIVDVAEQLNIQVKKQEEQLRKDVVLKLLLGLLDNEVNNSDIKHNIEFGSEHFISIIFGHLAYTSLFQDEEISDDERNDAANIIITNVFMELISPYGSVDVVYVKNVVFLFSPFEEYAQQAQTLVQEKAQEAVELIYKHFKFNIVCSLSKMHTGMLNIKQTYREAMEALDLTERHSEHYVKVYDEKGNDEKKCYYYSVEQMQFLISLLNKGDKVSAKGQIDVILDMNTDIIKIKSLRMALFMDIAGTIMKAAINLGYHIDGEKMINYASESDYNSVRMALEDCIDEICDFVSKKSTGNTDAMIEKIDAIIVENYKNTAFNVSMIADILNMNANYISSLYKRKTNKNILDIIQNMRINETKRLIKESSMSLERIAEAAGFGSFATFNRVFKKMTGVAPSIYRDMNKK